MKKLVVFASGSGSNAEQIILHFNKNKKAVVAAVFSNNHEAKVLEKAQKHGIPTIVFDKEALTGGKVAEMIGQIRPDLIVLAGFLLKFPGGIIAQYPGKVINIHPALLPKYGGKGMYGMKVHQAVLDNNEKESGITIHYVNEHYDEGGIIFQESVLLDGCKNCGDIAAKVQQLEHKRFPEVIERLLEGSIVRSSENPSSGKSINPTIE